MRTFPMSFRIAVSALALLASSACTTSNYQNWTPQGWNPPAGVVLPVRARVAVEPDPAMPQLEMRTAWWTYPDVQLMLQAGFNIFHRVFSDAGPAASVSDPAVTIVLKGTSSLNPTLNEYYANVTATIFRGADTYSPPLAVFKGDGKASAQNYTRSGILMAYEAAFAQIGNKLLADRQLIALIEAKGK
jgi:hypothetical protein